MHYVIAYTWRQKSKKREQMILKDETLRDEIQSYLITLFFDIYIQAFIYGEVGAVMP